MLNKFRFITVALLALMLSAFAFGQGTTGDISGTVTDSTGAVIPGATVRIESTGSTAGFSRTVSVNSNGFFVVANLSPGTYKVTITSSGFDPYTRNVNVVVDKVSSANATLVPAGTTAQVDVDTSGAVTIDLTDTKIDTNITRDIVDALPKGTNFSSLLKIAPNVRPETLGGGFQIDGASGSENVFVIDGQEVTNFRTGSLNSSNNLPFELLQEVQIKSTGFEAEYGGATGGVINAVTGGGNNDWHGNFGASFEPAKLQGRKNLLLNRFGSGPGQTEYYQAGKDGGTNFFPVANLSGPLVKDRLWGSVSYAPQIFETSRTNEYFDMPGPGRTVVGTETFDATRTNEYAFVRLDAQPISQLRVFGTFLWNPRYDEGEVPGSSEGLNNTMPPISASEYANYGGRQNSNSWNYQATWTPLNWMVINFRNGKSFLNEKLASYGRQAATRYGVSTGSPLNPCDPNDMTFPGGATYCRGFNTGSNDLTQFDVSTRTTYDVDASFVGIEAGGRHNIKVGYQRNELFNDVDSGYTSTGYVLLYYGANLTDYTGLPSLPYCDFFNINPNDSTCTLGAARFIRIGTRGAASSDNDALFIQDSWQIHQRVTLNFGLRGENEVVPSFGDPNTTSEIKFGWGDKLAPRFGAAIDLTGDGRTKVFGSYGWFYDRFKYELPRGLFGADTFMDAFGQIIPSRGLGPYSYGLSPMLNGRGIIPGGACPITGTTGWAECEFDRRVPSNTVGADPFVGAGAVDPDLKAMRQSEFTFGIERELGNNFVLAGRYTHKQLDRVIEDVGAFNAQGSEAYVIGNPGEGLVCEISMSSNLPCTKGERVYDAVEVRVDKRAAKYFFNASYTWSRLFGNYSGLASSDEFGRNSPNVNRFFDLPMLGYNANGVPDNGKLATDRPHVFKAYGGYAFDWGDDGTNVTSVSAFTTMQSGTPVTTFYDLLNVAQSILYGRGDLGRTDMYSETDLQVSHTYRFGSDNRISFEPYIDIGNIFDERNEVARQNAISTTNISTSNLVTAGCTSCSTSVGVFDTLFNGGGLLTFVEAHLAANPGQVRNDYDQTTTFQSGRNVRFGFRFRF